MPPSDTPNASRERADGPAIAIVGSGPAGCYLAAFLARLIPAARITIFERLPVPYGLVRYGVAPDHQGTKSVTRQFDRLFELGHVQFAGNIDVGVDISLDLLRGAFDVVALAPGLQCDRQLHVPGEHLQNVYRAGKLLRMVNAHPDERRGDVHLGRRVVIVGNGNVAIDVLRLLIKRELDFEASDIDKNVSDWLKTDKLEEIEIVGRSAPSAAKFNVASIRELSRVRGIRFRVIGLPHDVTEKDATTVAKLTALKALEENEDVGSACTTATFRFGWSPLSIEGGVRVKGITFSASDDNSSMLTLSADSIVTAVGFSRREGKESGLTSLERSAFNSSTGRIDAGLYCTGWFRRGARGTIPENRADSRQVAELIAASLVGAAHEWIRPGFDGLPIEVIQKSVSFAGWRAIDAAEIDAAPAGRVRQKIRSWAQLLQVANGAKAHPSNKEAVQ